MIEAVDHWGKGAPRRKSKSAVKQALALNRKPYICDHCGRAAGEPSTGKALRPCACGVDIGYHRRRIFSLSLGDWLDPEVPIEWLAEMLRSIWCGQEVYWLLCTKRPELWRIRLMAVIASITDGSGKDGEFWQWLVDWAGGKPPQNIWLLSTAENQEMADKRIPELLKIPAVVHGLSCEPLLAPLDVGLYLGSWSAEREAAGMPEPLASAIRSCTDVSGIDWVIAGGESGNNARSCDIAWIDDIRIQCAEAKVPCFVKQLGAKPFHSPEHNGATGYFLSLKDKSGADPAEWPRELRVRQFPSL